MAGPAGTPGALSLPDKFAQSFDCRVQLLQVGARSGDADATQRIVESAHLAWRLLVQFVAQHLPQALEIVLRNAKPDVVLPYQRPAHAPGKEQQSLDARDEDVGLFGEGL